MHKLLRWLGDYFRRADMLQLLLCTVCAVFGMVVISSATKSYETQNTCLCRAWP